jgi:formyltetrahydrofolate deformylase
MRLEWTLDGFDLTAFRTEFQSLAEELEMRWHLRLMSEIPRVAIFVSQYLHCLADLLHRHQAGELHCTIPLVIGNHPGGKAPAEFYGVKFRVHDSVSGLRERYPERIITVHHSFLPAFIGARPYHAAFQRGVK